MPDKHTHEWRAESIDYEGLHIPCIGCREYLSDDEISRRLNAYDKLVAERDLLLRGLGINDPSRIAEVLPASALEGE